MDTPEGDHEHYWETYDTNLVGGSMHFKTRCLTCGMEKVHSTEVYLHSATPSRVEPAEDGHYHCWHRDNYVLESFPPQYPARCCHCGLKRNFRQGEFIPSTATHGDKHLPSNQEVLLHAFRPIKSKDHY